MILPNSPFKPFIGKRQRFVSIVNDHYPFKVCASFQKTGLYGITQPVLGGLVNHIERLQRLHVGERSAVGTGSRKLHGKIGLALAGVAL